MPWSGNRNSPFSPPDPVPTGPRGGGARFVLGAVLLAVALALGLALRPAATGDPQPEAPVARAVETARRLYVTAPSVATLRELAVMADRSILKVPDLGFVAVYPLDDRKRFDETRAWIAARDRRDFEARLLDCAVGEPQTRQTNACTPAFTGIAADASGILLPGGADIPPSLYGDKTRLVTEIRTPARHRFEVSLLVHLLGPGCPGCPNHLLGTEAPPDLDRLPILAICLGMQTLNVARGGTLIQDIPSQVYGLETWEEVQAQDRAHIHREPGRHLEPDRIRRRFTVHPIRLEADWPFPIPDPVVEVTSSHHQAVGTLGSGIEVAARSMDGRVVEAIVVPERPHILGVQFHPEFRVLWQRSPDPGKPALGPLASATSRKFHRDLWEWFGKVVTAHRNGPVS